MYGEIEKTPAQKQADSALIAGILADGYTLEQAARYAIKLGWDAIRRGNLSTAVIRLNQAWLLDPDAGHVYWGFAVVVDMRDHDTRAADRLFGMALERLPGDPDLHVDYGRFLAREADVQLRHGNDTTAKMRLAASTEQFKAALALDPEARDAQGGLATNYALAGNLEKAYQHMEIAIERDEDHSFNVVRMLACMKKKGVTSLGPDNPPPADCVEVEASQHNVRRSR